MLYIAKYVIIIVLLALLSACLSQNFLIYPGAYQSQSLNTEDERIVSKIPLQTEDKVDIALYKIKGEKKKNAILMFHGNNDLATNQMFNMVPFARDFDIYGLEYRGYGGQEGTPSEANFNTDATTALNYIEKEGYKNIIFYGHSLGTAVAVNLCKTRIPSGLVLESPLASLAAAGQEKFPFLPKALIELILNDKYDSVTTLSELKIPHLLVMHGTDDRVINISEGKAVFDAAKSNDKEFKTYEGGYHNNLNQYNTKDLKVFLDKFVEKKTHVPTWSAE